MHLTKEELFYLKGMKMLLSGCATELRRVFKELWDEQNPMMPWADDAGSGTLFYDDNKPRGLIRRYDDKIKKGQRDEWDMTILCRVFIDYNFMNSVYRDNVKKLRNLRNIYSHVNSMSRSETEFQNDLAIVTSVFDTLGMNKDLLNEVLSVDETNDEKLLEEMRQLHTTLSQELIGELQQMRQEIHDRFDGMESRIGALRDPDTDGSSGSEERSVNVTLLPDWFVRLPQECRRKKVTEHDLVKIVQHIGANWELVAVELGIKKHEREKAVSTQRSVDLQMVDVFTKWTQKESGRATREAFIKTLFGCNDICTIDWDGIEEEFERLKI